MQTYLYIGNNKKLRDEAALEHAAKSSTSFDTHVYEASENGGIELVREIGQRVVMLPVNSTLTSIVVLDVENLTLPAMNAFLKTLEEPPSRSQIILTTSNPELLLPTIISRTLKQKINEGEAETHVLYKDFINSLPTLELSERLALIENIELDVWLANLRSALTEALRQNNQSEAVRISRLTIRAFNSIKLANVNVNKKMVKQNLVMD